MNDAYEQGLEKNGANYVALSPLTFLKRAALVFPDKVAVIHGDTRTTYRDFYQRCVRLASALSRAGVGQGDTVAVMAPNVPALLEAHYGVAMAGAVLNAINTRLDAASVGFILKHGGAKVLVADRDFSALIRKAVAGLDPAPLVVDVVDALGKEGHPDSMAMGTIDYEAFLRGGDPGFAWKLPGDEWQAIALNYTSGTTGDPKGVVYHHRGAYLNAVGNALAFGLTPSTVYLWTLPMFHCNGWTYPWAVSVVGGTHVCLRAVDPAQIFALIARHRVTHLCGAPIVLNMLVHSPQRPAALFDPPVEVATGGAAPPSAVIEAMESMGFRVTTSTGLTETYGPATLCQWQESWESLDLTGRAGKDGAPGRADARLQEELAVLDVDTGEVLPADGQVPGRDRGARQHRHEGLLQEPRRHRRGVPRRLVSHRRPGGDASRRLHRHQGPRQGHHHFRRREHLDAGSGRGALPPPAGDGGGGGGQARREVGRDASARS
jgi:fatty-acyl-CoA synthase